MAPIVSQNIVFSEELTELSDTEKQGGDESVRKWTARGANDEAHLANAFIAIAPLTHGLNVLKRIRYRQEARRLWRVTARYVDLERHEKERKLDVGEFRIRFDSSGERTRVFHSDPAKVKKFGSGAVDYLGAINVIKGKVEGVELDLPGLKIVLTYKHAKAKVTTTYMRTLEDLTKTRNNSKFLGFEKKELLLLSATGSDGTNAPGEVTFNMKVDREKTGLKFGSINSVTKGPHDFLWVDYEDDEDTTAKATRPSPRGVYVHEMFDEADWTKFGLTLT